MSKGVLDLSITRIGRVITIWDKVFFKLRVSFDGLVSSKKVLLESSHRIETHLDVVAEVLEVQSSVDFEFYLDEDFIEFGWDDLMFESPHATNFCRMSTFEWWSPLVSRDHSGRILSLGEYFLSGEDFEILIWSIIDVIIAVRFSVRLFVFS